MKIVIMAGGKGTRIASVNSEVPKPMIEILGKPILEYQIDMLKSQGYTEFVLVIGHLGHVIRQYFGDGKQFGVTIEYIEEKEPLGTAGALYYLRGNIQEDFLLLNGDVIFDVNIGKFLENHKKNGGEATILTHPNSHPYDSGIIYADDKGKVTKWLHKEDERQWYRNRVNAGIHILSPAILERFTKAKKTDLDRDILRMLIQEGKLYVYDSPEYVKDMGTPDRLYLVEEDIATGKVAQKNLAKKQKAIFLDRDGTINKYKGFIRDIDDFELLPGVTEAIKRINQAGYLAIVITNQPVIARGEVSLEELQEIHNKMETLLGSDGAYLDDIFYCPHHPDKGFAGERPEYKMVCECRKPSPGLFFEAAQKYNIDLSQSWMIGDSEIDMQAGMNAGCNVAFLGEESTYDNVYQNLLEAVNNIFSDK